VRTYEVVFLTAPTLTSEELEGFTAQMQAVVEGKDGKVVKVDTWGKKSLAYNIGKHREGHYVVLTLEADGAAIAELERRFRVTDHVMRFLSVRLDEDLKRSEKLKEARRRKTARLTPRVPPAPEQPEGSEPKEAPAL